MAKLIIQRKSKESAKRLKKHLEKEHPTTKSRIIIKGG